MYYTYTYTWSIYSIPVSGLLDHALYYIYWHRDIYNASYNNHSGFGRISPIQKRFSIYGLRAFYLIWIRCRYDTYGL